eukprot:6191812-Pleurochrysis_carterae.AAC.2
MAATMAIRRLGGAAIRAPGLFARVFRAIALLLSPLQLEGIALFSKFREPPPVLRHEYMAFIKKYPQFDSAALQNAAIYHHQARAPASCEAAWSACMLQSTGSKVNLYRLCRVLFGLTGLLIVNHTTGHT